MKKLVNSIALLVLVSVNVLTPISYAQESEVLDSPSVTDVTAPLAGSETSNGENFSPRDGKSQKSSLLGEDLEGAGGSGEAEGVSIKDSSAEASEGHDDAQNGDDELAEDLPEVQEDNVASLIDMVVDTVLEDIDNNFNNEQENEGNNEVTDSALRGVDEPQLEIAVEEGSQTSQDGCYTYNFVEGGIEIVSYSGSCSKFVDLSDGIDGYDVISIASYAFSNKGITGMILGDTVETIGSYAFSSLDYLLIGKNVKYIGYHGFISYSWSGGDYKYANIEFASGFDYEGLEIGGSSYSWDKSEWFLLPGGENNCFVFDVGDRKISYYYSERCSSKVVIPQVVKGFTVKSIQGYRGCGGGTAFDPAYVDSIIIPDTINNLEVGAACVPGLGACSLQENSIYDGSNLNVNELISPNVGRVGVKPYSGQELSPSLTEEMLSDACMYISEEHTVRFYDENGNFIKQITVEGYIDESDFPVVVSEGEGYNVLWINQYGEAYDGGVVTEDLMLTLNYKRIGILHEDEIIKISDGQNEIWLRDRNVGATASAGLDKANQIYSLSNQLCIFSRAASLESVEQDKNLLVYDIHPDSCTDEFYPRVSQIIGTQVTTIAGVNEFLNSYASQNDVQYRNSFGNYYFRGNNGYATYDDMNFDSDWYSTGISQSAIERGFMEGGKMDVENTGWEEGKTNNPCDVSKGEYLPTAEDWANLMTIWANLNDTNVVSEPTVGNLGSTDGTLRFQNDGDRIKFANDMLLPTAGGIYFSANNECSGPESLEIQACGVDEWYYENNYSSYLWTARDDLSSIGSYSVDYGSIYWNQKVYNNGASPVRCFMVANPVTVTFNSEGGTKVESYKVPEGSTITAPATPTKAGYTLEGWYTADGEKRDFENDRVEENMTLYAKWRVCGEGFTVKGNKCVPNDMDMEGIIEVSDGEETMYVRDRNVGAELSMHDVLELQDELCEWVEPTCICSFDLGVSCCDDTPYLSCSREYYEKIFGNYYFRGNNSGTNYAELVVDGNSSLITNMSELDSKFLEGGKLGDSEGEGWVEGKAQDNPCNGEGEYLPTPEDWVNLINIWANKNGYDVDNYDHGYGYRMSGWNDFMSDLMMPYAGNIWHSDEYYRDIYPYYMSSLSKNGKLSWLDDGDYGLYLYDMNTEWFNDQAGVVRCFVNAPDVLVITLESDGRVYKELNVVKGDTLVEPAAPSKSNATFDGWYTSDGEKYDFDTPFTEDMTLYAHWTESKGNGYSGGGGSSTRHTEETHNAADEKKAEPEIKKEEGKNIKIITDAPVNTEKETFNAHQWAYTNGLTKYRATSEARMDDFLNRSEMAKISSIFAMQFLDKTPNLDKKEFCSQYSDMWKVEDDMKFFITESCELGYMGYESNGIDALERFRPYTPLTVAETATILSRIVWGNENAMNGKDWYKGHLYATYNHGLIDDIKDPTTRSITRREAYTMLYRLMNVVE